MSSQRAETLTWDSQTREKYAGNYITLSTQSSRTGRGGSLRELNDAVFDTMASGYSGTLRVGRGAVLYGFVGKWMPGNLVGWIMGMRKVGAPDLGGGLFGRLGELGRGRKTIESGGYHESKHDSSDGGSVEGGDIPTGLGFDDSQGLGESSYVYPQTPDGGFGNRWNT
jgi:hypothetical protein